MTTTAVDPLMKAVDLLNGNPDQVIITDVAHLRAMLPELSDHVTVVINRTDSAPPLTSVSMTINFIWDEREI